MRKSKVKKFLADYWVPLAIMLSCWILSAAIMFAGVRIV